MNLKNGEKLSQLTQGYVIYFTKTWDFSYLPLEKNVDTIKQNAILEIMNNNKNRNNKTGSVLFNTL